MTSKKSNKKIKFAVIGCGHIGLRHAEMIQRNTNSKLVALIDERSKKNLKIDKYKVPFFNTLKEFFHSKIEVDVVNIATPNFVHSEQALICLENKKHVIIEKPMALTTKDAEKVIHKSLDVHKHVFTVMQNRYSPPSVWIKNIIDKNLLGKIYILQLNCFWNRDDRYYFQGSWHGKKQLDGGTLFTQFSHFIDMIYWLFGDININNVILKDFNHSSLTDFEDSGIVNFYLKDGGIGSINFSTSVWDRNMESSMIIIGENGSVKIAGQYMDTIEYCNIKNYNLPNLKDNKLDNEFNGYKGSSQNHDHVIQNVIDVLNNNKTISTNALEGLKVVDTIERIYNFEKNKT